MFGLVFAAFIFLYALLTGPEDITLLACVAATLPFLWYWHIVWAVFRGLIGLLVSLGGILGITLKEYKAGTALTAIGPIVLVLLLIGPALYLGSVYCLMNGINGSGEITQQNYMIAGFGLYGIGLVFQVLSANNGGSSSGKK